MLPTDRPGSGRLRLTSLRQDKANRLSHLRNCHITATETALTTAGTSRNCEKLTARGWYLGTAGVYWFAPDSGLRCTAWLTMRTGPFTDSFFAHMVDIALFDVKAGRFADACVVERDRLRDVSIMI